MTSRKNIRVEGGGLFSDIIPMRKSFMIIDAFETQDLDVSASTIVKGDGRRRTQVYQQKKSSIFNPNVTYPGASFLVKKLKRIVNSKLLQAFKKVKNHKKQVISLGLLNSINHRFVRCAFFTVKLYAQLHRGDKLQSVISRNKRPHLIFQAVNRIVKAKKITGLERIIKFSTYNRNVQKLVKRLSEIVNIDIKLYYKRQIINRLKINSNKESIKQYSASSLNLLIASLLRQTKICVFEKVITALKVKSLQNSNQAKKQMTWKLNQSSVQRVRTLNLQRQKIRQIKSNLDDFSANRTRSRYDSRRDLNNHRTKLKQEEKIAGAQIANLNKQNQKLENQLQEMRAINSKRLSKVESKINRELVQNLYLLLVNEQVNKLGQIKLKLAKQKLEQLDRALQNTDEFHIHENQKLRMQVFMYESINISKARWPQELAIVEQNQVLKSFISCIINRKLQNLTSSTALHEQQFQ